MLRAERKPEDALLQGAENCGIVLGIKIKGSSGVMRYELSGGNKMEFGLDKKAMLFVRFFFNII